ncbi:subunit length determinant protein [Dyadobacter jejuensis]|uniref:Subunit length determinant protein n=1 Tax=Dyadobacter jejuensis TaxID=1082580 RepID=A0A316ASI3_9BACT|nr:hypothetical protein [Dyadobacter jejuensis]PWJ60401.1 subunit length determinant protein [Dyadobacter jejuensis]
MVNNPIEEQDILEKSVLYLIRVIGKNFKFLILAIVLGGGLGIGLSYMATVKYKASAELLPEFSRGSLSSLGSLASLAGLNTSSGESDAIRPDLYPNILQSNPAVLHLLKQPVESVDGKKFPTLFDYYKLKLELQLPPTFLNTSLNDSIVKFKPEEMLVISSLKNSIESNFDSKLGMVTIGVEMEDPKIATITLANCISYLKISVNEYRYGKNVDQGDFLTAQLSKAKDRMGKARYKLQKYRDNNRNIFTNAAKIEEQKLQEEYSIAFSIYNSLLGESERLNISSQDEKPLFQILNPPVVPNNRSSPNRLFYAVGCGLAGFMITLILLLVPWRKIRLT